MRDRTLTQIFKTSDDNTTVNLLVTFRSLYERAGIGSLIQHHFGFLCHVITYCLIAPRQVWRMFHYEDSDA